jgi:hypothetical protein
MGNNKDNWEQQGWYDKGTWTVKMEMA